MSTEDILTAAKEYTAKGWVVHPLSSPKDNGNSPGKRPLLSAWQELTHTPEDIGAHIKKGGNIGLVCGCVSGVIVLDFDSMLFYKTIFPDGSNTLESQRIEGRRHVYLKYHPSLTSKSDKHLKIELQSDKRNLVLPPSIHAEGQTYDWINPETPIRELTEDEITRINGLFQLSASLQAKIKDCGRCFERILELKSDMTTGGDRSALLGLFTELKLHEATDDELFLMAKLIFKEKFDKKETETSLRYIDIGRPHKCESLRQDFGKYIKFDGLCDNCNRFNRQNKGKKKSKESLKIELPLIPQEQIEQNPITIHELLDVYKKYLYIEENESITIPLAETISNFAPIEPDIMGIIGASGSSKTEVIRALGELENQYIYPVSSITGHTLVSGFEDNVDLAPSLRGRLLTIKDFTTLLAKKKDEVSEIFADLRELTDGHIGKDFGSGVKKHYTGIHTSILFGCTNAIEKYNSMFSLLGQRILFFRPRSDKKKAMYQAMKNAGKESAFRDELHKKTMQFIYHILNTKKDRLTNLSHIPEVYGEMIGELVYFLAIVRTHIDRDFKGEMATLPEPEYPTRLAKTMCKLVDAHAVIHDREPIVDDLRIAYRLVLDNIPTDRLRILNTLLDGNERTTSEVQEAARVSNAFARRILEDLKALEVIEYFSGGKGKPDIWQFTDEKYREILTQIQDFSKHENKNSSPDAEQPQGAIRLPGDTETIKKVLQKLKNKNKGEKEESPIKEESHHLSEYHPGLTESASNGLKTDHLENQEIIDYIKSVKEWNVKPDSESNRNYRVTNGSPEIARKFNIPTEKAYKIFKDYCKARGWGS
ncbi:Uncharacterised protein [uncultured archaeon]|nr:Uncharacterised protein [uncultured archaeon]